MIKIFTGHPTAANLLMVLFIVVGILTIPSLRRETFPDFTPSEIEIKIPYPGSTAGEVEEVICQRVEDVLHGIKYVKEIRADAREGIGIITVEMNDNGNFQIFKDDIETEIDAIDDFPSEIEDPIITRLGTTEVVLKIMITGLITPTDLKAYCQDLKNRMKQETEISLIEVVGFSDHQFRIELAAEALSRFNLSVSDVAGIIARQNINLPAGTIETSETNILLRIEEERRSPSELENLVILANMGGAQVKLGDIGNVVDLFEVAEDKIVSRNQRAGVLQIEKTKNQDVIRMAKIAKEFVESERQRQPNIQLTITSDRSTLVVDRLQMLIKNACQGMVLVFFTMWLFFNLKLSFWVTMSLPVSFLGAFFMVPNVDLTINMMTMVGLLLALGLLMDDGIVIAENIAAHLTTGKSPMQAAIDGVTEVKSGVISSFITTVCILGPLASISGDIGKVLKVIPLILILVMAISLVEAFLILPSHLGHSLQAKSEGNIGKFRTFFDNTIKWINENLYGRLIDVALSWRYLFIGLVFMVFLLSLGMIKSGILKFQAFPELDGDVIVARLLMPPGTPLQQTEQVVEILTSALDRVNHALSPNQPNSESLVKNTYVQYNKNADAFENGPHLATLYVDILSAERRNNRLDEIKTLWRKETGKIADITNLVFTEPSFGPAGRPIEIRLQGNELNTLKLAANALKMWLGQFEGVSNLADDLRFGKNELKIKPRQGALALGLDAANMAHQLRAAFHGITADEIQLGEESYEIDVRLNQSEQDSLADLDYFYFTLSDGKQVPIGTVATIEADRGWSRIARVNGLRAVTLRGDIDSHITNTAEVFKELKKSFLPDFYQKFPNINLSFEGEIKEGGTTQQSMVNAMLTGVIGVFILLSFQFRSYIEPLVVLVAIPLAFTGVVWGHLIMGIDLSMPSTLGFMSLAGIVVNDSILLVIFLKNGRQKGIDLTECAAQAGRKRFRAIILTSLTTIAGLFPLMAEKSLQAQILIPLAISITFGLIASTVLVLFVVPCLYTILGDWGLMSDIDHDK